jgi:hypothetical protein
MRTGGEKMIKLNTFTLEEYSAFNKDHRKLVNTLKEDVLTRKNISKDLIGYIDKLEKKALDYNDDLVGAYAAYLNRSEENVLIGLCGVDRNHSRYTSFISLLNQYRNENLDLLLEDQLEEYLTYDKGLMKIGEETYSINNTPVKKRTLKPNKNER